MIFIAVTRDESVTSRQQHNKYDASDSSCAGASSEQQPAHEFSLGRRASSHFIIIFCLVTTTGVSL